MLLKKPFTSTGVILTQPNTPQASELLNCLPPGILTVQPLTSPVLPAALPTELFTYLFADLSALLPAVLSIVC